MPHPAVADTATELVLREDRGAVAVLAMNRLDARNAVNAALSTALGEALAAAAADPLIRAIVITGRGRTFSAGADLKALAEGGCVEAVHSPEHPEWDFAGVVRQWTDKPTIAAVNGPALGGGLEIALACDLVVASESAIFGLPESHWGLFAAAGGAVRIHHLIGMRRALEMVLTGAPIDAVTALEWGLVNRVVPQDDTLQTAIALAALIASNGPRAVQVAKRAVHQAATDGSLWGADWSGVHAWEVSSAIAPAVFASAEGLEGMRAFAEKREPRWID